MKNIRKLTDPVWVFFYFCAATFFMTWPLSLHLKTAVIGGMGDNIYFVWLIRWYQKVFIEGQGHPFFNPWMNYPQGWNLNTTETTLATALPGVPFSYFLGPIAGYNIAILLTFVLAGFFMYLWVRDMTKSNLAGILAGFIYTFSPYHVAHFVVGHLNLCGLHWFPLFFWGFHRILVSTKKWDLKFVLLTSISLGLIAFTSMYYLYMTVLFSVLFGLSYLCFTRFKLFSDKYFWLRLVAVCLISFPFLFFALRPFMNLSATGVLSSRSIEYAATYSASPTDFFLPSSDHFLFGGIVSKWFDRSLWNESSLYFGFFALILAVYSFSNSKKSIHRGFILSALMVILASFVLGLGINLHWNNQDVMMSIQGTDKVIYLPAAWLFNHLPFFDKMRAVMRFGFFVLFFMPVLAAIGFQKIQSRLSSPFKQTVISVFIFSLIFFDFYPGSYAASLSEPQPRAVDLWLADQSDEGAVVQMPFSESVDQSQIYYSLFHQKPFTGGFFNANQPIQYQEVSPVLDQFPDEASINLLSKLDVKYIVLDNSAYQNNPAFDQQMASFGLIRMTDLEGQAVYTFSVAQ